MIFLARYSWILFVFENADDDPWQIKPWWTLYRASAESGSSVTRGMISWRVLGKGVCVTALIKCGHHSAFEFIWKIVCVSSYAYGQYLSHMCDFLFALHITQGYAQGWLYHPGDLHVFLQKSREGKNYY